MYASTFFWPLLKFNVFLIRFVETLSQKLNQCQMNKNVFEKKFINNELSIVNCTVHFVFRYAINERFNYIMMIYYAIQVIKSNFNSLR